MCFSSITDSLSTNMEYHMHNVFYGGIISDSKILEMT